MDAQSGELYQEDEAPAAALEAVGESKARLYRWVATLDEAACRSMVEALEREGISW